MSFEDDLARARAIRDAELVAITEMRDDELDYLARVGELNDPDTDGVECDHEERYGDEF